VPHESSAAAGEPTDRQFSLWQRIRFALVAGLASAFIALVGRTLRVEFSWEEGSIGSMDNVHPGIYPFWHRCVLGATWIFRRRNFAVLTSQSRDGEFIARVIHRFGYVPIRGSSSRGGQRGLLEMRSHVMRGYGAAFTIDGPRGPRYVAKKGPVVLARTTGVPITAFYVALEKACRLNTWDAMMLPKPFSRAYVRVARKIFVPADATDDQLEAAYREMQAALERVTADAEAHFSSARN
jgi:lysophospholipid acyltransferase (LPLAT)-like uncharacterized protein